MFENTISKKQTKSFDRIKLCLVGKFSYFELKSENVFAKGQVLEYYISHHVWRHHWLK